MIAGAKIGNQVIGAYKILTNSDAYAKLCQILGTTCKGCYWQTYTGKPYAYAILPEPIDPNLNVLVMQSCPVVQLVHCLNTQKVS